MEESHKYGQLDMVGLRLMNFRLIGWMIFHVADVVLLVNIYCPS